MKKILFLLLLLPFFGFGQTSMPGGDYIISSTNNGAFPYFKTITSAVKYLNDNGIQGNVKFLLNDTTYDLSKGEVFPITITEFSGGKDFTVTIKPNVGKTVNVNASTLYYNDPTAVFKLDGADNVIFDGCNNDNSTTRSLTLYNSNPNSGNGTPRAVIWIASNNSANGANNNIIRNIILKQYHKGTSQISIGIFAGGKGKVTDAAEASNSNTTITNVDFTKVGEAIYVNGGSADSILSSNWIISNNIVGNTSSDNSLKPYVAVHFMNVKDYIISNNVIDGLVRDQNQEATSKSAALWIEGKSEGKIFNNKISNIRNALGDAYVDSRGIYINASNNLIYNNFISNVSSSTNYGITRSNGIYIESGINNKIYYNTIVQNSTTNLAEVSSCLYINNGAKADIRNNIFYNIGSGVKRYAVYLNISKTVITSINFNDYYAPVTGFLGSDQKTLANWKAATSQDTNSQNILPKFVSPTNFHLQNVSENDGMSGVAISDIKTDIDGDIRTKPYMGADEIVCKLPIPSILTTEPTCEAASTAKITNYSSANSYEFLPMGPSVGADGIILGLIPGIKYTVTAKNGNCSSAAGPYFSVTSQTTVFNGSWSTPPTANLSAEIRTAYSSKGNENLEVCSLLVTNNASVTINAGGFFKVYNAVKVEEGSSLIVESDANLIQVNDNATTNSGKIIVKRNAVMKRLDYTYWSSPVQQQQFKAFSPSTVSSRFLEYHESDDYFYAVNWLNNFVAGKGYAIRAPNNFTTTSKAFEGAFVGTPNNGEVTFPLKYQSKKGDLTGNGYNLIGNPYPSNIDFSQLVKDNDDLLEGTAYFWTNLNANPAMQGSGYPKEGSFNNYATLNRSGSIPATFGLAKDIQSKFPSEVIEVGQGFIVKAKKSGNLVFKNTYRTVDSDGVFFNKGNVGKAKPQRDRYWVQLITPLNVVTTALIAYIAQATNGYEVGYDAELLSMGSDALFSTVDNHKLGIQGRQFPLQTSDVVSLGMHHYEAGNYTLSIIKKEGVFANGQNIYLKDKQTGSVINLSEFSYSFAENQGLKEGRFEIIYRPETVLVTDTKTKESVVVYRDADQFVIKTPKRLSTVFVYDLSGKMIKVLKPNQKEVALDANQLSSGVYVLSITTEDGEIFNRKISK